jgi:hypothetical protein
VLVVAPDPEKVALQLDRHAHPAIDRLRPPAEITDLHDRDAGREDAIGTHDGGRIAVDITEER